MFPEAPPPTVPITLVEDTDLDAILIEFPNHLTISTVMEHFRGPIGGHAAGNGYVAKAMAERLSVHRNVINGLDFDAADRLDNLASWVRKFKKSANTARRKRQAAGQSIDLVSFEGQHIKTDLGHGETESEAEEVENSGAPTPLGLRLNQRAVEAIAELAQLRGAKPKPTTNASCNAEGSSSREKK